MTAKPLSAEFDLSVLSNGQLDWLIERAQNHHFSTVMLDSIGSDAAQLSILYDDEMTLTFVVSPEGEADLIGKNGDPL